MHVEGKFKVPQQVAAIWPTSSHGAQLRSRCVWFYAVGKNRRTRKNPALKAQERPTSRTNLCTCVNSKFEYKLTRGYMFLFPGGHPFSYSSAHVYLNVYRRWSIVSASIIYRTSIVSAWQTFFKSLPTKFRAAYTAWFLVARIKTVYPI